MEDGRTTAKNKNEGKNDLFLFFFLLWLSEGSPTAQIEVRGQRSGWPSPLCVISPVVIWLAETLGSPANLISAWRLFGSDQISPHSRLNLWRDKCSELRLWMLWLPLMILSLLFFTQPGTQLVYGNIIILQAGEWRHCPYVINVQECISGGFSTKTVCPPSSHKSAMCLSVMNDYHTNHGALIERNRKKKKGKSSNKETGTMLKRNMLQLNYASVWEGVADSACCWSDLVMWHQITDSYSTKTHETW